MDKSSSGTFTRCGFLQVAALIRNETPEGQQNEKERQERTKKKVNQCLLMLTNKFENPHKIFYFFFKWRVLPN